MYQVQQYLNLGMKPVTSEVQEAGTVLVLKTVEDRNNNSSNNKMGYNGTYILCFSVVYQCMQHTNRSIPYCTSMYLFHQLICCFFAPLRRVFTRIIPVPGTSVSSIQHPYPNPELPWVLLRHSYPYPILVQVLYARATIPGVRIQH